MKYKAKTYNGKTIIGTRVLIEGLNYYLVEDHGYGRSFVKVEPNSVEELTDGKEEKDDYRR